MVVVVLAAPAVQQWWYWRGGFSLDLPRAARG